MRSLQRAPCHGARNQTRETRKTFPKVRGGCIPMTRHQDFPTFRIASWALSTKLYAASEKAGRFWTECWVEYDALGP